MKEQREIDGKNNVSKEQSESTNIMKHLLKYRSRVMWINNCETEIKPSNDDEKNTKKTGFRFRRVSLFLIKYKKGSECSNCSL